VVHVARVVVVVGALLAWGGCPGAGADRERPAGAKAGGSDSPPSTSRPPPAAPGTPGGPAPAPLRRLTQAELNRTLRALFPVVELPFVELNDGDGKGFEGDVARQTPSDLVIEQVRAGAIAVSAAVAARPELLLPRAPVDEADEVAVGRELVAQLGPRALRRPLEPGEAERYGALFEEMRNEHGFAVAVQLVLQAFLQSPSFLYRLELGADGAVGPTVPLGSFEMASRLSYLLWSSMPDEALFAAAAAGRLSTPDELEAQARRMLADERAKDAILSFHRQWLDFDKILTVHKDTETHPSWSEALRASMRQEADAFIEEVFFGGDATLRSLLTARTTRVDASLAALYGIAAPAADWSLVELPGAQRAGVLTQAAFLAGRSHAVNPSPVLRGVFVLERLMCEAIPPPSSEINTTPPEAGDEPGPTTNRQRYAQHTFDPVCQGCHAGIDGIGMGLESYDAIGAFRTLDQGLPVDDSGSLEATSVGGTFAGGPGLAALLADSEIVQACAARHWLAYAHGRSEDPADEPQLEEVNAAFGAAGGDVRELLVAIVRSPAFRNRPSIDPDAETAPGVSP
jgi:hypothetical protein